MKLIDFSLFKNEKNITNTNILWSVKNQFYKKLCNTILEENIPQCYMYRVINRW